MYPSPASSRLASTKRVGSFSPYAHSRHRSSPTQRYVVALVNATSPLTVRARTYIGAVMRQRPRPHRSRARPSKPTIRTADLIRHGACWTTELVAANHQLFGALRPTAGAAILLRVLTGRLLAESLRVGADLAIDDLRVVRLGRHDVSESTLPGAEPSDSDPDAPVGATDAQPQIWTFVDFEAPEEQADALAQAIADALETATGWWADFIVGEDHVVVSPTGSSATALGIRPDEKRPWHGAEPLEPLSTNSTGATDSPRSDAVLSPLRIVCAQSATGLPSDMSTRWLPQPR